jgi:hypothetical protein
MKRTSDESAPVPSLESAGTVDSTFPIPESLSPALDAALYREPPPRSAPFPSHPADARFKELRICDLLKERCYIVQSPIVRIVLELSETPPLGWSYIFMSVWDSATYDQKPRVGIDSDTLWIECEPSTLKSVHLPELQQAISETNLRYGSVLREQLQAKHTRQQLDLHTLEELGNLDLGLKPRIQVRSRSNVIDAYLQPIILLAFCILWSLVGIMGWSRMPDNQWSWLINPVLVLLYAGVLYWALQSGLSQIARRWRTRQWVRGRISRKTLWPSQYVDRKGRD